MGIFIMKRFIKNIMWDLGYISIEDAMIEKLAIPDTINPLDFPIAKKLNEVIDYLNKQEDECVTCKTTSLREHLQNVYPQQLEPKAEVLRWKYSRAVMTVDGNIAVQYSDSHPERVICFDSQEVYAPSAFHYIRKDMQMQSDTQLIPEDIEKLIDPPKSKWEVGDDCWYVQLIPGCSNKWKTELASVNEYMLKQIKDGDLNVFKTRRQAEAVLAEIKEVLEKYQ
jgi:hypothetical protein